MTRTFECMFLVDNDAVRAGWREAKAAVTTIVEKHEGKVLSSRRWDERRLAYPINHRNRATFLLNYCEFPTDAIEDLRRELDLDEMVMRYMITSSEGVPEAEVELAKAEDGDDFEVPEPPEDNALDLVPEPAAEEGAGGETKPTTGEAAKDAGAADGAAVEGTAPEASAEAPKDSAEAPKDTAEAPQDTAGEAPAETPAATEEPLTTEDKEG